MRFIIRRTNGGVPHKDAKLRKYFVDYNYKLTEEQAKKTTWYSYWSQYKEKDASLYVGTDGFVHLRQIFKRYEIRILKKDLLDWIEALGEEVIIGKYNGERLFSIEIYDGYRE